MIDIEIDEPYVANTGQPIHGISSEGFFDRERNEALVSENWVILRFSEEQVVKFPEICLSFIKTICSGFHNGTGCEVPYLEGFSNEVWSFMEAKRMATNNYRQVYLPAGILESVFIPQRTDHYQSKTRTLEEEDILPF